MKLKLFLIVALTVMLLVSIGLKAETYIMVGGTWDSDRGEYGEGVQGFSVVGERFLISGAFATGEALNSGTLGGGYLIDNTDRYKVGLFTELGGVGQVNGPDSLDELEMDEYFTSQLGLFGVLKVYKRWHLSGIYRRTIPYDHQWKAISTSNTFHVGIAVKLE